MPYKLKKNRNGTYEVLDRLKNKIHSKHTSLEKAKKQIRLLEAIDHGWMPTHIKS